MKAIKHRNRQTGKHQAGFPLNADIKAGEMTDFWANLSNLWSGATNSMPCCLGKLFKRN